MVFRDFWLLSFFCAGNQSYVDASIHVPEDPIIVQLPIEWDQYKVSLLTYLWLNGESPPKESLN